MNGAEFIRNPRKWAQKNDRETTVEPARGKGGHQMDQVQPGRDHHCQIRRDWQDSESCNGEQLNIPGDAF